MAPAAAGLSKTENDAAEAVDIVAGVSACWRELLLAKNRCAMLLLLLLIELLVVVVGLGLRLKLRLGVNCRLRSRSLSRSRAASLRRLP